LIGFLNDSTNNNNDNENNNSNNDNENNNSNDDNNDDNIDDNIDDNDNIILICNVYNKLFLILVQLENWLSMVLGLL